MKQLDWIDNIKSIEAEILLKSSCSDASAILKQFSKKLSTIIKSFLEENIITENSVSLTNEQKAFVHSLQLYDFPSVLRLVNNYDVSKGLKVILPGIEKSCRSLLVIKPVSYTHLTLPTKA